jgi:23S rRNA (uracil1939-C5)-methyltransferase
VINPGTELTVVPEKPVAGGSMLARHEGRIVLVRGAIPGEAVRVRVERAAKGVVHAVVVEVLEAHTDRRQPPIDPACGGNALAHVAYPRQLALKSDIIVDAFARLARVNLGEPVKVAASPERGYRVRARFHVAGGRAGFYREGTHELCDPETSGQLQPGAVASVQVLVGRAIDAGADPVDIVGIELAENVAGTARAAHLDLRRPCPTAASEALRDIDGLTGLSWSSSSDPRTHVLSGTPYVFDEIGLGDPEGGLVRLRRHARSFFQANRYLVSALVDRVVSLVPEGPVIDLYAGVGLFAVAMAPRRRSGGEAVTAVEGDATSAEDLAANAASCATPFRTHHLPVEEFLQQSGEAATGTVVLDPPRTGLSRAAGERLAGHRPSRIVYVSCDVATLARDVKTFSEHYALTDIAAFDLFPNTAHVETVVVLDRR